MDAVFFIEQLCNGLGYGLMLFLLAAGLTLVFGIMDTLNSVSYTHLRAHET